MKLARTAPFGTVTDDDGTGTTGTVLNNAWVQGIEDLIDTADSYKFVTLSTTGSQNNWAPGLSGNTYIEWTGASDLTVTGITGGASGQVVIIKNAGTANILLPHGSASSSVGNRLFNFATTGSTPLAINGCIQYIYNGTLWVAVYHDQGSWITPAFSAGNYTSTGTWTVASGDVTTQAYRLAGKTMVVDFDIQTTTVSGTPTLLNLTNALYGSFTSTKACLNLCLVKNAGGAFEVGYCQVGAAATLISVAQMDAGTWSNATDTTSLQGQITFEVT